jgi:hypothetical protein
MIQDLHESLDTEYNGCPPDYELPGIGTVECSSMAQMLQLDPRGTQVSCSWGDVELVTVASVQELEEWLAEHRAACNECGCWEVAYMSDDPFRTCENPECQVFYHRGIEECDTGRFCREHGGHTAPEAFKLQVAAAKKQLCPEKTDDQLAREWPFNLVSPATFTAHKCTKECKLNLKASTLTLEAEWENVLVEMMEETVYPAFDGDADLREAMRSGIFNKAEFDDDDDLVKYLCQLSFLRAAMKL